MQPVLILGAGINGAALARELVLNGVPVWVVDNADIASGATAASSRLIHGGLRYLEYGELGLVRESLDERARLLRLAPQFVRPLRLFIPVRNRWSGCGAAIRRFFGRKQPAGVPASRGLWLVRAGLWMYDRFARDGLLAGRATYRVDDARAPAVDTRAYRWQCAYSDAAIQYPERFVIALMQDARQEAARQGIDFRVLTYHRAALVGEASNVPGTSETRPKSVEVTPVHGATEETRPLRLAPSAIVNATGAWVDHTLRALGVKSRRLIGGTKGSHFVTSHAGLREALAGRGVYAEAADGRPVFVLPLGNSSLVGTTDIPFTGDPAAAVATEEELAYLLDAVNLVFPELRLARGDIDWHYSGVRPLPHVDAATPAAITRRHWLEENTACPVPLYSVIGGKLTTCRSLAEEAADVILRRLRLPRKASSRDRPIPGGENYPSDESELESEHARLAARFRVPRPTVEAVWRLHGTRTEPVLQRCGELDEMLEGTLIPVALVRWAIEHEWAERIDDLICRRLMLLDWRLLSVGTLEHLAELMALRDGLPRSHYGQRVSSVVEHLVVRFGKRLPP